MVPPPKPRTDVEETVARDTANGPVDTSMLEVPEAGGGRDRVVDRAVATPRSTRTRRMSIAHGQPTSR